MIITIKSDSGIIKGNILNTNHTINLMHNKDRVALIESWLDQKIPVIVETYSEEIIDEIIMVADDKGMIEEIELIRCDPLRPLMPYENNKIISNGLIETHYDAKNLLYSLRSGIARL